MISAYCSAGSRHWFSGINAGSRCEGAGIRTSGPLPAYINIDADSSFVLGLEAQRGDRTSFHLVGIVRFGQRRQRFQRPVGGTHDGTAGLAAASTAGNAAAVPAIVAAANPAYKPAAATATVLVATSVVVTAILVPIVTAWWYRRAGPPRSVREEQGTTAAAG